MKNITMTLPEHVVRWARIWAAERDTSVSRFVGEVLREWMEAEAGYEASMKAFLDRGATALKRRGGYPPRDELHDRASIR